MTTNEDIKKSLQNMQKVSEKATEKVRESQKRQKFIIEQAHLLAQEPEALEGLPDLEE